MTGPTIADAYIGIHPSSATFAAELDAQLSAQLRARLNSVNVEQRAEQTAYAKTEALRQQLDLKTEAYRQQQAVRTSEMLIRLDAQTTAKQAQLADELAAKQAAFADRAAAASIAANKRASASGLQVERDLGSLLGGSIGGAEGSRLGRLGATLTSFKAPAAAAGIALAVAGGEALKFSANYQAALAKVRSTTTITEQDFAGLSAQIQKVASATGESQIDLATAAQLIYSDGLKGSQATDALAASALGARAGLGTVEDVANVLGPTLNAYAGTGLTAAHATDLFTKALQEGHIPVGTLADSVGKLVGTASSLGVQLPDLLGTFATLSQTNPNQARVTTGLNAIIVTLSKLSAPTKQAQASLKALGLSQEDLGSDLRTKGLLPTIELLSAATDKYAKANGGSNDALLRLIPNQRALLALFGTTAGDALSRYVQNEKGMAAATNTTSKAAQIALKTLSGQLDVLKADFHNAEISAGNFLLPLASRTLSDGAVAFHAIEGALSPLVPTLKDTGQLLVDTGRALEPIIAPVVEAGFGALALSIRGVADVLNPLLTGADDLAKFLAENKDLAEALAVILGVSLTPRLLDAAAAAKAFAAEIAGIVASKVGGALYGIGDAAAAAVSPFGLAAAAAGGLFYAYEQGKNAVDDYTQSVINANNVKLAQLTVPASTSLTSQAEAAKTFGSEIASANDQLAALANTQFTVGATAATSLRPTLDYYHQLHESAIQYAKDNTNLFNKGELGSGKEADEAYKQAQQYANTINELTTAQGTYAANADVLHKTFKISTDDAYKLSAAYGLDLSKSAAQVVTGFENASAAAALSHDPLAQVNADVSTISTTATSATDQVTAFTDALNGLIDPAANAANATVNYDTAVKKLADSVTQNGAVFKGDGSITSTLTAKADANISAITGLLSTLEANAKTAAQNLASTGDLNDQTSAKLAKSFADQYAAGLKAAGVTDANAKNLDALQLSASDVNTQLKTLIDQLNTVPKTISTQITVTASGSGLDALSKITATTPTASGGVTISTVRAMASGGLVPGSGNTDNFPALLMPGEYVLTKDTVSKLGAGNLDALNGGSFSAHKIGPAHIQSAADRGVSKGRGSGSRGGAATVYVDPGVGITDADTRKLYDTLKNATKEGTAASATALDKLLNSDISGAAKTLLGAGKSDSTFLTVTEAQSKRIETAYARQVKATTALAAARKQLTKDTTTLKSAQTAFNDLAKSTTDTSAKAFDLSGAIGTDGTTSAASVVTFLQQQAAGGGQFTANIAKLKSLGFSKAVIDQIEQQDPQTAARLAQALAGSTSDQVASINSGVATGASFSQSLGQQVASDIDGPELNADTKQVAKDNKTIALLSQQQVNLLQQVAKLLAQLAPELQQAQAKPIAVRRLNNVAKTPALTGTTKRT